MAARELWGNGPDVLAIVRDPWRLADIWAGHDISHPRVVPPGDPDADGWAVAGQAAPRGRRQRHPLRRRRRGAAGRLLWARAYRRRVAVRHLH